MLTLLKITDLTCGEAMAVTLLAMASAWLFYRLIKDIPDIIRKMDQEENKE